MKFTKMQGAGNDFIIVETDPGQDLSEITAQLCERRFSVGADGLMVVRRKDPVTATMRYYNADGSVGEMCGNGARCLAMYAYTRGIVDEKQFVLETLSGPVKARIIDDETVRIAMGRPVDDSPFEQYFYDRSFEALDRVFTGSYLLMGVPHLTIPVEEMDEAAVVRYGPVIEHLPLFSAGTNVNFVKVLDRSHVMIDTWERGAGKTLACGTGALASAFSLHHLGLVEDDVVLHAPGGDLRVLINPDGTVDLQGPALTVFEGDISNLGGNL